MPSADPHLEHRAIRSLTEVSHMDPDGFFCVILDFVVNLFLKDSIFFRPNAGEGSFFWHAKRPLHECILKLRTLHISRVSPLAPLHPISPLFLDASHFFLAQIRISTFRRPLQLKHHNINFVKIRHCEFATAT